MNLGRPRRGRGRLAALVSLLAVLGSERAAGGQEAPASGATLADGRDAARAAIAEALNRERAKRGLGAVRLVPALCRAAQTHASDMEARRYFGFKSPGGRQIEDWVAAASYEAQLVTEKIEQTDDPPARMAAYWGQSPELEKNSLFHPEVDEVGIGIGQGGDRRPIYAIVLTRSKAAYLADYTRRLFAEQTARFRDLPSLRREMLARVNGVRGERGLPPLAEDAALDRAAQRYAEEIFRALAAGLPLPRRGTLARRVADEGYRIRSAVGEAVVQGALSAEETLAALLGGADRGAQVLRKSYTDLGLGLAFERRGDAFYAIWVECLAHGESGSELASEKGSDARTAWLRAHAIPIRTIDPADEDFRDLAPLRAVLGNARVVMLGEASHGDGATFRAKGRLVRFLQREMGFSVLAFESGLYDCAKAWERLAAGEDPATASARGVFGIWSASAETRPLWAELGRLAKSASPLELAGFDSQFTGSASRELLVVDLARYLRSIGSPTATGRGWPDLARRLQALIEKGGMPGAPVPDRAARRGFARDLERLDAEIAAAGRGPEAAFWRQVLRSTRAEAEIDWDAADDEAKGNRRRDLQMAENLLWLARERYPGRKIIVWAATRHILANPGRIATADLPPSPAFPGGTAMGDEVKRALGPAVYALGFTSAGGWTGKAGAAPRELPPPTPGSLEALWSRAGAELAFVDFRRPAAGGSWLSAALIARPLGHAEMRADWTAVLDGMMFLRAMTPATRSDAEEGRR
jgi:erythromycin esterase